MTLNAGGFELAVVIFMYNPRVYVLCVDVFIQYSVIHNTIRLTAELVSAYLRAIIRPTYKYV